jgi:hypothetical protein
VPAVQSVPSELTPLPPLQTPLAEALPELERAARLGNARAACRIGLALNRCRLFAEMSGVGQAGRLAELIEQRAVDGARSPGEAERELDRGLRTLRMIEEQAQKDRVYCAGVDPARFREIDRWQFMAATNGSLFAIDTVLGGSLLTSPYLLDNLDLLERYRDEAPAMIERGLRQGAERLPRLLFDAHVPPAGLRFGLLAQVVRRDAVTAHALLFLLENEPDRPAWMKTPSIDRSNLPRITPEQAKEAQALATTWIEERRRYREARQAAMARAGISEAERREDPCLD